MSKVKEDEASAPFTLKNTGHGFAGRSNDIFGGLDVLELQHISHVENRTESEHSSSLKPDDDDDFGDKRSSDTSKTGMLVSQKSRDGSPQKHEGRANLDSVADDRKRDSGSRFRKEDRSDESEGSPVPKQDTQFRRPVGRAVGRRRGRHNRVPDHGKTPQNWTYYSLEDVKGSDMSDKANTKAALAFLEERRKHREDEETKMDMEKEAFDVSSAACSKGLFSFAKRNKATETDSGVSTKSKPDKDSDRSSVKVVELTISDEGMGTEGEGSTEEEPVEPDSSVMKESKTESTFKSRKGIKRNIRSRDDDD